MASCDLQTTRSQEDIVNDGSSKNVNNPQVELKKENSVTKIPGPVMLDASGSFISLSNRQYTSVMGLAKRQSELRISLQEKNTGMGQKQNDQEHDNKKETMVEMLELENNTNPLNEADDSNPMNQVNDSGVQLDCSATDISVVESKSDELPSASPDQPILQDLLDEIPSTTSKIDMQRAEQQSLRELQRAVAEMEADVAAHSEALDLEVQKEEQIRMELLKLEATQDSAKLPENNLVSQDLVSEDLVSEDLVSKDLVSEDFVTKDLVADDLAAADSVVDNTLAVDSAGGSSLTVEPIADNLVTKEVVSEKEEDANVKDLLKDVLVITPLVEQPVIEKPIEKEKVQITIQARLTPASSTTGSLTDRKMVRLDQLLDAENNIDLLRQLLENDTYNDVVDSNETNTAAPGVDKAKSKDEEKTSGFLQTVFKALCSRKMLQPILLCSLAVGLVYFLRKA